MAGDLLLVELDPTVWRRDLRVLDGRLCVIRLADSEIPHLFLGRVSCSRIENRNVCRMHVETATSLSDPLPERSRRIELDRPGYESTTPEHEATMPARTSANVEEISPESVLGVVIEARRVY
jgi:hypothetical protein